MSVHSIYFKCIQENLSRRLKYLKRTFSITLLQPGLQTRSQSGPCISTFFYLSTSNYIKQVCSRTSRTYWPLAGTSSGSIYYPTSNMLSGIVLMLVLHPIVSRRKQNQNIDVYAQNQNQTQRITNFMKIFKGFANVVEKPLIGLEYSQSRSRFVVNVADG